MSETTLPTNVLHAALTKPQLIDICGVPHVATPPDFQLHAMEKMLPQPRRIATTITAHDVTGFISYVLRFRGPATALYSGPRTTPGLYARLDDHQPGAPSHVSHNLSFLCPRTLEWTTWTAQDRKPLGQVEFAEFIERNLRDIVEPNGADLLTAALAFQDSGRAEFRSAVRLTDGRVQYQFVEKEDAGEIRFPAAIKVALPVFEGQTDRYACNARLRYRIKDGQLSIWFELDRPDLVLRQAYEDLMTTVEQQTGLIVHRAF